MIRTQQREECTISENQRELTAKLPKWAFDSQGSQQNAGGGGVAGTSFVYADKTGSLPSAPAPKTEPDPAPFIPPLPPIKQVKLEGELQLPNRTTEDINLVKDVASTLAELKKPSVWWDWGGKLQAKAVGEMSESIAQMLTKTAERRAQNQYSKIGADPEVMVQQIKLLERELGHGQMPYTIERQREYYLELMTQYLRKQLVQDLEKTFTEQYDGDGIQRSLIKKILRIGVQSEAYYKICGVDKEKTAKILHELLTVPDNLGSLSEREKIKYLGNFEQAKDIYVSIAMRGALSDVEASFFRISDGRDICSSALKAHGEPSAMRELFMTRFGIPGARALAFNRNYHDLHRHVQQSAEFGAHYLTAERQIYDQYFAPQSGKSYEDKIRSRLSGSIRAETLEKVREAQKTFNQELAISVSGFPEIDIKNAHDGIAKIRDILKEYPANDNAALTAVKRAADRDVWQVRDLMPHIGQRMNSVADLHKCLDAMEKELSGWGSFVTKVKQQIAEVPNIDPYATDVRTKVYKEYESFEARLQYALRKAADVTP